MKTKWIVKLHYPHGSHTYQTGGSTAMYETKEQAAAVCEVLNAANRSPGTFYIPVEMGI